MTVAVDPENCLFRGVSALFDKEPGAAGAPGTAGGPGQAGCQRARFLLLSILLLSARSLGPFPWFSQLTLARIPGAAGILARRTRMPRPGDDDGDDGSNEAHNDRGQHDDGAQ